jgi:hypothetical protein
MAFDGYILYRRLNPARPCDDATLDLVARLLAGAPATSGKSPESRKSRTSRPRRSPRA